LNKRTTSRALVAALSAALAFSGVVAAKDHPNHGKSANHGAPTGQTDKAAKVASLKTKGNASHPGGVFRVLAIVKAGPADRPLTVDAIVSFATGDVAAVLTRSGNGAAYHANVPVPDAEPAGTVLIDATAVVLGATLTATGSGKIVVGGGETEAPDTLNSPDAPETCTPEPSEAPEASEAPESPEASDEPEASDQPAASSSPDAGGSPNADPAADCDSGDALGLPLTADVIRKLIAYLESLLA
jgi:hypothetical protein